ISFLKEENMSIKTISNRLALPALIFSLAFFAFAASAVADSYVFVVTGTPQFGTVDLNTGAFTAIGPGLPVGGAGLVPGPNGSLLTLGINGDLYSINPSSGIPTLVGPTGLVDCSLPTSPCGLGSANTLGELNGTIYATDFAENLYKVNPSTGQTTKIGSTGMVPITFVPLSTPNPDGSLNFYDSGLYGQNGKLYGSVDTGTVNFSTGAITTVIPDTLYQIDPLTGLAASIAPTVFAIDSVANVNGTDYTIENNTSQILTIDLANGDTTVVGNLDPSAGLIFGATPTPEPGSLLLFGAGLLAIAWAVRRKVAARPA
ncbi:MAG: PEP-CTERM sorting domain-containing protein, partial [Acidobacteriota bacterium]|nr:PEP-CTERM sorting domain-containing protein [Acidobacteriota bacterium]